MRRTLVVVAMLAALGVLAVRVWPVPGPDPEPARGAGEAPSRPTVVLANVGGLDQVPDDVCAGPAVLEMMQHPHWELELSERAWDDVVDDQPDEPLARVHVAATFALWEDGDLPQQLELTAEERVDLLLALQGSCARVATPGGSTDEGNGLGGSYIEIAYGRGAPAFRLPSRSRAAIDAVAVLDRVRGRYVAGRLGVAETLRLSLPRLGLTIERDGSVVNRAFGETEPLAALERVDVLDWAMQLPTTAEGARVVTGTLEVAGGRRTVAVDLDAVAALPRSRRNQVFSYLASPPRLR